MCQPEKNVTTAATGTTQNGAGIGVVGGSATVVEACGFPQLCRSEERNYTAVHYPSYCCAYDMIYRPHRVLYAGGMQYVKAARGLGEV